MADLSSRTHLPDCTDPAREAVLVIDMQQEFFRDQEMAVHRAGLVDAINTLAVAARRTGVPIVEIRTVHDPDGSTWTVDMRDDDAPTTIDGTPGAMAVAELELRSTVSMTKTRNSAFHATDLDARLEELGVDVLVLAGISTEACIAATALDAYAHDYRVILAEDAITSIDDERHRHAVDELAMQYRQPLVPVRDLVARWEEAAGGADRTEGGTGVREENAARR